MALAPELKLFKLGAIKFSAGYYYFFTDTTARVITGSCVLSRLSGRNLISTFECIYNATHPKVQITNNKITSTDINPFFHIPSLKV